MVFLADVIADHVVCETMSHKRPSFPPTQCYRSMLQIMQPPLMFELLQGITGSKMEKACDLCHITLNKNAVVGDVSAMAPGGVRIGAPAMTSRGLKEADFEEIAELLHKALLICKDVQEKHGKLLKDFTK